MKGWRIHAVSLVAAVLLGVVGCAMGPVKPETSMIIPGGLSRSPAEKVGTVEWITGRVRLVDQELNWLTIETPRGMPITLHVNDQAPGILGMIQRGDMVKVKVDWEEKGGSVTIWDMALH